VSRVTVFSIVMGKDALNWVVRNGPVAKPTFALVMEVGSDVQMKNVTNQDTLNVEVYGIAGYILDRRLFPIIIILLCFGSWSRCNVRRQY